MSNNTAALELVCETANSLFPELNMRPNELSQPTEAFLTKVLILYLRSFGFRLEPPYNIETDTKDSSREKRQFLSKLCRQVERIVQISFPGKTFSYFDLIEPTVRKTSSTLDVLFNYKCFYKMHKREVISPIADQHKKRQALIASIAVKRNELEKNKQKAAQIKKDIAASQETISKLSEDLPKAEAELQNQSKILRQKQNEFAVQEEKLTELNGQVNKLKELLVQESDVEQVKTQIEQTKASIKSCTEDIAKQEELYNERRKDIEKNLLLNDEIDKAMKILPPETISDFKDNVKLRERMEKKYAALKSKYHSLLSENEKEKQHIEQCEKELRAIKLQYEQDAQVAKENIADQEALITQQSDSIEEAEQRKNLIQAEIDDEQDQQEYMKVFVTKAFDEHTI